MRKKVTAGAIATVTLIAGIGFAAPAYAADFTLVGPDTVPTSDKFQITALGLPADVATDEITWKTSQWRNAMQSIWPQDQGNTSTWDADMTPYEDGTVTISATYQGQTAEKTVQLEKKSYQYLAGFDLSADGLEGSDGEYTLHIPSGGTVETTATFTPDNATYQHLVWQSMDPSIVRGGADGVIRAVNNGTADLVVYSYGRIHKKTIHVTVGGDAPVNIPVESVSINGGDVTMQTGETKTLSATVAPENATNKKVTWSTSNPMVASVDNTGKVTARKAGTVTITATAGGKSASITVTIEEAPPAPYESVKIDGGDFSVKAGETHQLTAKLLAADGTEVTSDDALTWSSSNTAVASVDANGLVTGVAKGTADITVTVGGKTDTVTATVTEEDVPVGNDTTVYYPADKFGADSTYFHYRVGTGAWTAVPGVKMTQSACNGYVSYVVPDAADSTIEFVFNNGNNTWDNNSNRNYTGQGATLVVENGTVSTNAPCVVTVPVESVAIAGGDFTLKEGASKKLSATVTPANATDKKVIWASSDASVATVDASGTVKGVKAGTATITATAGGKSATVKVTVTPATVPVESVAITGTGVKDGKLSIENGKSVQLNTVITPSSAVAGVAAWSSSDTSVVAVDGNGKLTAKQEGMAAITVTVSGKSASLIVTVTKSGQSADRFSDVPAGILFHDEIEWLAAQGVTMGNSDGTYGYADSLNRRDMAIFLYRLAKVHGVGDAASYVPSDADYARFSDVRRGDFGAVEVLWMASHGIANGTDGRYEGLKTLNRRDMAIFLARYARLAGVEGAGSYRPSAAEYGRFSDVSEGMFGAEEILWMAKAGITKGNADGSFGAYGDMQRHAMAAFLYRLDKLV
ncbi:Ig-like domain-containing protein [Bifidobacterium criceti]|nr:Ig-like domain-containing protein [Bifidobacterium criceti]